jgi:hypothetical protein
MVILSSFCISIFPGCEPEVKEMIPVSATLKNKSTDNVHMWIQGETIGSLNKLGPGGFRTAQTIVHGLSSGWTLKIYAGRDGETLDTYTYVGNGVQGTVYIQFTSTGILAEGN